MAKYTWREPGFVQTDQDQDRPVVYVSWNDAVKFCEWLSRKEKKTYGLPTEAQWEYACRAGTTTAYSFGNDPKMLGDPNSWGLYDMHDTVWQWCADYYDEKYYQVSPNKDPKNILNENACVLRGGSWDSSPRDRRSAVRRTDKPAFRGSRVGFRVVLYLD